MKILNILSGETMTLSNGGSDVKFFKEDIAIVGFNGIVKTIIRLSDGKYFAGGSFSTFNGVTVNGIIKLNSNFTIDTSFRSKIYLGSSYTVTSIAVQPDGKVLVAGNFTVENDGYTGGIFRLTSAGDLDTTFNYGIGTGFATINSIVLLSTGKVIIGGAFTSYNNETINRFARLNSDGSLDTLFNIGSGFGGTVNTIAAQPDGKLVIGGLFTTFTGTTQNRLIRLNSDGTKDTSFNIGTAFNNSVTSIAIQNDGKIVVGGNFTTFTGTTQNRIVRLNSNGTKDTSFNIGTGFNNIVNSLTIQNDGKIVVGGNFTTFTGTTQNRIIRLNSNGSKDSSFVVGTGLNASVNAFIVLSGSNNTIIVAGNGFSTYNGKSVNNLVGIGSGGTYNTLGYINRINIQNGALNYSGDQTANYANRSLIDQGFLNQDIKINNGLTKSTSLGSNNTIQLGGLLVKPTTVSGLQSLTMISPNLTIQGLEGKLSLLSPYNFGSGFNGTVSFTNILPDGKKIFGGSFTTYSGITAGRIIKLNSDDSIDYNFIRGSGFDNTVSVIVSQTGDTKLIVGGWFSTYATTTANRLIRLNANGSIDTTFNIGTGFNGSVGAIEIQSDNKYLVGGSFTTFTGTSISGLIRLNTNGTRDTSFNIGSGFLNFGGDPGIVAIAVQSDGKIVVGGTFTTFTGTSQNNIIRLNSNGSKDSSFNVGTGFSGSVSDIIIQPDGKILVCGSFATYNGTLVGRLTRLNTNGTIDTSFKSDSTIATVNSMLLENDGKLFIGGQFTTYSGQTANCVAKINSDGSPDSSFIVKGVFQNGIFHISKQSDNKIIAVGNVSRYNDIAVGRILRFNSDGSVTSSIDSDIPLKYNTNLSSSFTSRSIPDVDWVSGYTSTFKNVVSLKVITSSGYTVSDTDHVIHCSGLTSITLSSTPKFGQQLTISDAVGNGGSSNITINGNGKQINNASSATIDTDFGTVVLTYNGIRWIGYSAIS
jgi:uncharacterized delta-60 repeat protein